jgi:phage/plasmid-like protein (TIGR03299 family)
MAHELEMVDGKAQMAYTVDGGVPWQGLGVPLEKGASPTEMMVAAGLDWEVEEHEAFIRYNGDNISTGQKSLVRKTDGRVLTNVGKNWHPVQNSEAFDFFAEFCDRGQMEMHTAGSLKEGEIIWALAKVDDDFELFGGDKVESYMLFSNPHQYGKSIDIRFTPIRVVCNNTLSMSLKLKAQNAVKVNHRSEFNADRVKEMMGVAHFKMSQYKDMAEFLGSRRTTEDTIKEYFGTLLGGSKKEGKLSRTGERALEVLHEQPGAEFAEGSWWSAFNAVTYLADHEMGRAADTRMQSSWYGANQRLKVKALETALDMADA